jgi:predicted nucleotidyltransferase component of viral defense system
MLFSERTIADSVLFRGGTALHKLHFPPAARYSEDIDLVQREAQPIGKLVEVIRDVMSPSWKGRGGNKRIPALRCTFAQFLSDRQQCP